ncbi:hypothetical protein ONS95_012038 [Cadophora gregata]|uniref:uncharacterized protein n=1 Tax=Cadophora gregata TaxID=51156 RepID=UPI0026DB75E7|nr:uncharacterized protein ONS95_012038 [Cadophora gregata]KAK0117709.1 hypothetical protein ONS95_012038 [Cadophora gregata]KAK0122759.1 hypothetical protein ONS96_009794 [Cadophora gregata f. sp. sojae]
MVLQNASDSAGQDTFQDSAPSSDNDPYASLNSSPNSDEQSLASTYHVDVSKLPKPLPWIGSLAGYNEQLLSKALTKKIAHSSQILQRPLSQEEVDAFAFWTAKQVSILSYGVPFGVGGGLWRCWSTADTFRMPFYRPNAETFNPQVFPPRIAILKGNNAVMAWHACRAVLYGGMGNMLGQLFFGSYSMSVATVGEMGDKRLKPFIDAVKAQAAKQRGSLPQTSGQPGIGQQPDFGTQSRDDASPGTIPMGERSPDASWESMSEKKQPEVQAQPKRWPQARPMPTPPPVEESSDQPFGIFDDASPTGGQGVQADIRAAPVTSQGGSAWDRIRRGEQSSGQRSPNSGSQQAQNQNAWSRLQKDSTTTSDGYSYSKTEETNLAKGEAQKDFDARVERERSGGDFAKGNGDQRRW